MKNLKATKLFVLALSVALLIGAVVGISVSANDSESYGIEAINVIYKDQIFVAIAVDAPADKAGDLEVSYTFNGKSYTAQYHSNMAVWEGKGDNTLYPVFVTVGIPAKDMGEDVIAEAHVKGGTAGATKNISVASYLYQRLYKDGIVAATEGEDLDKKGFYLATLDYIAYAQKVLYNNANPDATPRTLVTDYVAVYASDAKIGDSAFTVMKSAGDVTLTYTGAGSKVGWNVTTYNDNGEANTTTSSSDTISLTESAVITPIVLDFQIGTPSIVETFENGAKENILTFSDGTTINAPTFGDYTYTSIPYTGNYSNTTGETVAKVVEYELASGAKSKALNMFSPGRINSNGSENTNNRSHSAEFMIMESVVPQDKINAAAIEFDFKLGLTIPEDSCAKKLATDPTQLVFRNYPSDPNNTGNHGWIYFQINPQLDVATKTLKIAGVAIPNIDEFVRIKLVVDYADKLIHVYANGVFMGSGAPNAGSDNWNTVFQTYGINVASISCYNASGMSDVYLDNVSFYNTYCLD